MQDINCPNCGTTYPSLKEGICECCGYEFTSEYLNPLIEKVRIEEEENKKKRLAQEKIEAIKRKQLEREQLQAKKDKEKRKTEELKALEQMKKDREQREKLQAYINKQKDIAERDKNFSLKFKSVRKIFSKAGVVLSVLSIILCIFTSVKNNNDMLVPANVISSKVEIIKKNQLNYLNPKISQTINIIGDNQSSLKEKAEFIHIDKLFDFMDDKSIDIVPAEEDE